MLLENVTAVNYGAAGAIGGRGRPCLRPEAANLFLTGRNTAALDTVAKDITAAGGIAQTARAAARRALKQRAGVILTLTAGTVVNLSGGTLSD